MTIVVGFVASDGVVVAADSQAGSFRGVEVKRSDYTKIYELNGSGSDSVRAIVAGAGSVAFITKAVSELRRQWNEKRFRSINDVEGAVEEAMVTLAKRYFFDRQKALQVVEDRGVPKTLRPTRLQQGPAQVPEAHLLIGAVDSTGAKLLATVGPEGIAETEEMYTSVGSGSAYAEYILARLYSDQLSVEQALECAVYTVEQVKRIDPNCGGPVRAVAVTKDAIRARSADDLRDLVSRLEIRDDLLGRIWRSMVLGRKSPTDIMAFLDS